MGNKKGLSIRAYAKHRGVSHVAVIKAIQSGRITPNEDGSINAALADKQWAENTDLSTPLNSVTGRPKHRKTSPNEPSEPMEARSGEQTDKGPSYAKARAVREQFAAALAKLEFEEKSGKLISRDEVRIAAFNAARKARDSMLAIPDRIAPILAGITDDREVHRILTDELRRVCSEIASATYVPAT